MTLAQEGVNIAVMSDSEAAARRLRVVRDLPSFVEGAFRAAVREVVFTRGRGASFVADLRARADFHLDRALRGPMLPKRERSAIACELERDIVRFTESRLARRLACVPRERLHVAPHDALDLLVDRADGVRFALRFARVDPRAPLVPEVHVPDDVAATLVYTLDDGKLRRFDRRGSALLRTA